MKKQFPRTALRVVAMALALAGLFGSASLVASGGVEPSGRATYDPLLDVQGDVCAPSATGRPPLLQKLVLAQGKRRLGFAARGLEHAHDAEPTAHRDRAARRAAAPRGGVPAP